MRHYLYPILALTAATTAATAAPRSLQEARLLAEQELTARLGHAVALDLQQPQHAPASYMDGQPGLLPYYHFSHDDAFVLIAGSDLLPAVIGYGQGQQVNAERPLPPGMQDWLDQVAAVEQYLESNPAAAMAQAEALSQAATFEPISPIMTCQWGQDEPYNDQCPKVGTVQTVVGCMATALSQIIYTQKFPSQSYGQVSYKSNGRQMSANLEGVTYDYSLMCDKYNRNNTQAERNEVAKLSYNVGLACMMQYGEMSGTISMAALQGMTANFGMTKAAFLQRAYYALNEWNEILQGELLRGNPVLYSGQSSAGGHAFVLDGMDERGYYHVNWGWDGYYDGYFDVSLLRTDGAGTGAAENGGFYLTQEALVNLCNPDEVTEWHTPLRTYRSTYYTQLDNIDCSPKTGIQRGTKLTLSTYAINYSNQEFKGKIGVRVMKDGEVYAQEMGSKTYNISKSEVVISNNGNFTMDQGSSDIQATYTLPNDLADGTYRIYLVSQPEGMDCVDAVRQYHFTPSYWTLTVEGNNLNLKHNKIGVPVEASAWNFESEQITSGPNTLTCQVHNTSDETMAVRFYLRLTYPNGKNKADIPAGGKYDEPVTLAAGESCEISFPFDASMAGSYTAKLYGTPMGLDTDTKTLLDTRTFNVALDPTRSAELTLMAAPILVSEKVFNGQELTMVLKVKNTGTSYDGKMSIRLFTRANSTAESNLKAELTNESVQIGSNETKEITISDVLSIASLTKNTKYYARGFYLYGDEMRELDGNQYTAVPVYATTGIEQVKVDEDADDLSNAEIYNLVGKRVMLPVSGQLKPGIYIVNGRKRVVQ